MTQNYDAIIAGGGLSGALTACKILSSLPNAKILILEKEKFSGGRLRTTDKEQGKWSFGINAITPDLKKFSVETIGSVFPEFDLSNYNPLDVNRFAQLSGSKLSEFSNSDVLSPSGAKAMGGRNAGKEFADVESLFEKSEGDGYVDDKLSKQLKLKRKSPGSVVLEHQATAFGIPDVWNAGVELLKSKKETYSSGLVRARWDEVCEDILEGLNEKENVTFHNSCHIISAKKNDSNGFTLKTEKGIFETSALIIAQNPWAANRWLDKEFFPVSLINLVLKSKPVSLVTLSCVKKSDDLIPDMTIIPAEKTQVISYENSITFQATIDYEMSLASLEVVKAVKRLRRARKRMDQFFENTEFDGEFVALLPCAWPIPAGVSDRKLVEKLTPEALCNNGIQFCGDTYGTALEGDSNIISSVKHATLSAISAIEKKGLLHDTSNRRQETVEPDQRDNQI